jgi:N-acetylglucosaminyl-diphospho-decaprenol L-rhamnosyltransferase
MMLAIIIVSFNARADLDECLGSVYAHPPTMTPFAVVVVDNASTDGSPEMVRNRWPSVRLIALPANLGFAAANNVGIRATSGDLILLLNSDTVITPGALDGLVSALQADPRAAIAGPRLVDAQGVPELSFGRMVGPFNELRQKLLGRLFLRRAPGMAAAVGRRLRQRAYHDWVSGACLLVWREAADAAGLLDERYFMYLEDVDFCAAIRAQGRTVLFVPEVEIVHLRGRSRAAAPGATNLAYRRSQLAFYAKHHPAWTPWLRAYLRLRGVAYNDR